MKTLNRNKQLLYYALYQGKTEVMVDGEYTGEYQESYSSVVPTYLNISPARGTSEAEMFGINTDYSKTIVADKGCPITETTILWLDISASTYNSDSTYSVGEYAIYNGEIYKCIVRAEEEEWTPAHWAKVKPNYSVVSVAKSLNSVTYAIKENA